MLDNGHFGETGMQRSHTSFTTDLVGVAKGFGVKNAYAITEADMVDSLADQARARKGLTFAQVFIETSEPPRALPSRDGVYIKNRFRATLGLKPF